MSCWMIVAGFALSAQASLEESALCSIDDPARYYGYELQEEVEVGRAVDELVEALYRGPLRREPDARGRQNLATLLTREDPLDIRSLQRMMENHLYGDSTEFAEELEKLERQEGENEGSYAMLESIYDAFGYRSRAPDEAVFDACLIRNRQAHLVLTKVMLHRLGMED